jgi:tRNA 2-thiouridine synthesizing protein A
MSAKPEILDLRGLKCPLPVLKAQKALRPLSPGTRLWIETTDPLAVIDIPAFCNEKGHQLIETQTASDHQRFLLEKG